MTKEEFLKKMAAHWDELSALEQSADLYELEKDFDQLWTQAGNKILNGLAGEVSTQDRRKKKDTE